MILPEELGNAFGFQTCAPGELNVTDLNTGQSHSTRLIQFWADAESIFILAERANYTFKKSKDGKRYILTRIVLVKIEEDKHLGMRLPGAEVYNWEGDEKDDRT